MKFENEYFNENYANYNKQNPKRKIKSYLKEILRYKKSGKLLDMGCAYGVFIEYAKKYFDTYGTDTSEYAIKIAEKKRLEVRKTTTERTPFKENMFDVVTMFDVIEHIPNLENIFTEVRRILKRNGIFVLSMPVYDGIAGKIVEKIDKDPTHIHKESRSFWIDQLKQNGFKIIEYKGIMRCFFLNQYYIHKITRTLRGYAPAILIIAIQQK
jgi:2-polyprenyl-3-methyl-5-hydroxy-6-metoxy-1,4-benzoquinol methylase